VIYKPFLSPENLPCDKYYYHPYKKLNSQGMYACKNSQVAAALRYHIRKHMAAPQVSRTETE
jgi:hypothetical protein